jgi:hypothetical protein
MVYFMLHLTIFQCEASCLVPLTSLTALAPRFLHQHSAQVIQFFRMSPNDAQIIGQILMLGDCFIVATIVIKGLINLLRRFLYFFIVLAIGFIALRWLKIL